ncbi:hypothetical protein P7C73_g4975, partial [Tremellales sp. Uapishka_1]
MITITIVSAQSTSIVLLIEFPLYNLKAYWAGWSDAPLSVHGMNQAKALGLSLKHTKVDAIFASPLLRALWTVGQSISSSISTDDPQSQQIEKNQSPKPPLTISPLLREQHFGIAERKPFGEGKNGYVRGPGRHFKFDDGESLDDVRKRANEAIANFIEPILQESRGQPASSKHIVVVAHGIFNAEFIGALLARRKDAAPLEWGYRGMTNTGWTRLEVGYKDEARETAIPKVITEPEGPVSASSAPASSAPPPLRSSEADLQTLAVSVLCTDVTTHLDGVHRQKGGIGSQGFDEKQKDLRAFFGGASSE